MNDLDIYFVQASEKKDVKELLNYDLINAELGFKDIVYVTIEWDTISTPDNPDRDTVDYIYSLIEPDWYIEARKEGYMRAPVSIGFNHSSAWIRMPRNKPLIEMLPTSYDIDLKNFTIQIVYKKKKTDRLLKKLNEIFEEWVEWLESSIEIKQVKSSMTLKNYWMEKYIPFPTEVCETEEEIVEMKDIAAQTINYNFSQDYDIFEILSTGQIEEWKVANLFVALSIEIGKRNIERISYI